MVLLREIIKIKHIIRGYASTAQQLMQRLEVSTDDFADEGHLNTMAELEVLEPKVADKAFQKRMVSTRMNYSYIRLTVQCCVR